MCGFISAADTVSVTQSGGGVCLSRACGSVFARMWNHSGAFRERPRWIIIGLLRPFLICGFRYCYRRFFCTSRLRTVTLPSWRERGVMDTTPCPYLVVVILHMRRIDRTYKWHLWWKEACAIVSRIIEGTHYWSNLSSTHSNYIYTTS